MKKVFLVLGLMALTTAFVACGSSKKPDKSQRVGGVRSGDGVRAPTPPKVSDAANSQLWGSLTPQGGSINDMGQTINYNPNDVARIFLNADWPWGVVGSTTTQQDPNYKSDVYPTNPGCQNGVNCAAGLTIGSDNGGKLILSTNDTLATIGSKRVTITGGSITMAFWDSLTGTPSAPDSEGNTKLLDPIPVWIPVVNNGSSFIQGNKVEIHFQDVKGTLDIYGDIQTNGMLTGRVMFNNVKDFSDNNAPASGKLGDFTIHKCAVFRCQ